MNKEKFLVDFKNKNTPVEIIGDIVDWKVDVKCKCLLCNEEFYMRPINLKRGSIHSKCSYKIRGKKKKSSTNEFKDKLYNVNKYIEVIGEYEKAIIPIEVKCKICGHIWKSTPNNLLRNHGCPICYYNKISTKSEEFKDYDLDKIRDEVFERYKTLNILEPISNLNSDINCECQDCGYKWTSTLRKLSLLTFDNCCPVCAGRKFDSNELLAYIKDNHIDIENVPKLKSEIIKCTCQQCNYSWETTSLSLLNRKGCPKCNNRVRKTHEEFLEDLENTNPNVKILSKYVNSHTKVKRKCLICGDISELLPRDIKNGSCKGCMAIKMRSLFRKTHEEFCSDFKEKYGDTYNVVDTYINSSTKIKVKHNICGNDFMYNPSNIYNKSIHICPYCYNKTSNGEKIIENFFNVNYIDYNQHKTFPYLRGVRNGYLSYDFYLEKQNLLIEFQGIQHYEPVEIFGGEKQFKIQQEHDKRKREYAINNNIKLLEIPYWDFDNVEEILSRELGLTA